MRTLLGLSFFMLLFTAINIGLNAYAVGWLLRYFPSLPLTARTTRLIALLLAFLSPFGMWFLRHNQRLETPLTAGMLYIWMGSLLIFCTSAFLTDIARLAFSFIRKGVDTRPFFGPAGLTLAAVLIALSIYTAARPPLVRIIEVPLPNLPQKLDGFKIAVFSDVHLSTLIGEDRLKNLITLAAGQKPDAVFLLGDMRDHGYTRAASLEEICAALPVPPERRLGVLGNHEYYNGMEQALFTYRACGFRLLRNEIVTLDNGIQVAGMDDVKTSHITKGEVFALLKKLDPAKPSVYLQHQPMLVGAAAEAGAGLMLSGHTHAGQIWPFKWMVRTTTPYIHGLYKAGGMMLYVTSGNFYWGPPMRLFARHELPIIVLRSPGK